MNIIQRIKNIFFQHQPGSRLDIQMDSALIREILLLIKNTDDIEITCGEVFNLLDQYVETEQRGEDSSKVWPLVRDHLDRCADCHEEFEALVRVVQSETI